MRVSALLAAGLATMLAMGCEPDQTTPITLGNTDPTQTAQNATVPDGLTQWAIVTGPSASTGNGETSSITIETWLQNSTPDTIVAVVRPCALQPSDFIANDSAKFVTALQAQCVAGSDTLQTVSIPPFGQTAQLQDTYALTTGVANGLTQLFIRLVLQAPLGGPPYWMQLSIGGS